MADLAALHDRFVAQQLPGAPFHPEGRKDGSDYNLHYVDLEADTDQFHAEAKAIFDIS